MRILLLTSLETMTDLLSGGFRDLGHEVLVTGITSYDELTAKLGKFKPDLIITNGWGDEQTVDNQIWIRNYVKQNLIPHIYWSIEDPTFTDSFVIPLLRRMEPDAVFTLSEPTVAYFQSLGFKAAHLDWAFQPSIHHPVPSQEGFRFDIALVANSYHWVFDKWDISYRIESMRNLLIPLLENQIRVDIFGKGWEQMKPWIGMDIHPEWLHGPLPYTECKMIYSSAKIILGLKNFTSQVTQRTYEVLAAGGFLLTSDTPAVRKRFKPDHDLIVSAKPEDTLRQVAFYLNHADKRNRISRNGTKTVSSHTFQQRAEFILTFLNEQGILRTGR